MNQAVEEYHAKRRPFIIIPQVGIIIGELGQPYSHREILKHIGCSQEQIFNILENCPRGYFLNNKLVIYQSDDIKEGESWLLKEENYVYIKKYYADLQKLFHFDEKTQIFLGVYRGKEGEIWPTVKEVSQNFFS